MPLGKSAKYPAKKYNFVYKTTNLINGKEYIGFRCTNNINDGYIGCGIKSQPHANGYAKRGLKSAFIEAVIKYGYKNFSREILSFHDTRELAVEREIELVDESWILNKNSYNCALGGNGGCGLKYLPHRSDIIKDYLGGEIQVSEIADRYGVTYNQVMSATRGLDISKKGRVSSIRIRNAEQWIDENIDLIISQYKNGASLEDINKIIPMYIYDSKIHEILKNIKRNNKYVCVTPNGNVIEFISAAEISSALNESFFNSGIILSCKGAVSRYKGYNFYYMNDYLNKTKIEKIIEFKPTKHTGRKFTDSTGTVHIVETSLVDFCNKNNLTYETIMRVLRGELTNHKGFKPCQN